MRRFSPRLSSLLLVLPLTCVAHSTPSDFASMSIEQLFAQNINEGPLLTLSKWAVAYQYNRLDIGGYRTGTTKVPTSELLWAGPGATRTNENFPVMPTNIVQQVHLFRVSYAWTPSTSVFFTLPWIHQSSDHISIVPGYDEFRIDSQGMGDVQLNVHQELDGEYFGGTVKVLGGLSVPTGSIDEEGDTPRAPGDQQLPYTMQLGSGTWDMSLGLAWRNADNNWLVGLNTLVRTGNNARHYRLGNHYSAKISYHFMPSKFFTPYMGVEYRYLQQIIGQDDSLLVPTAFPYPASITNPKMFGGTSAYLVAGADISVGGQKFKIDLGVPIYQNLNGPQPESNWKFSLNYSYSI